MRVEVSTSGKPTVRKGARAGRPAAAAFASLVSIRFVIGPVYVSSRARVTARARRFWAAWAAKGGQIDPVLR